MGIPKFYRWLSERYPLINEGLTDATQVSEFGKALSRNNAHLYFLDGFF